MGCDSRWRGRINKDLKKADYAERWVWWEQKSIIGRVAIDRLVVTRFPDWGPLPAVMCAGPVPAVKSVVSIVSCAGLLVMHWRPLFVSGRAPGSGSRLTGVRFHRAGNPQVSVTLQRADLPTFFSRIWGRTLSTVRATAVAEAYNPGNAPAGYPPIRRSA